MRKALAWAVVASIALAFAGSASAQTPNGDVEQRCTDLGSSCICSEPMITSGSLTQVGSTYDLPGSSSKQCGFAGRPLSLNNGSASMQAATGTWATPAGSGIGNVLVVDTNDGLLNGTTDSLPTGTTGRRCERIVMHVENSFIGRNSTYGGTCAGVKGPEMDPAPGSWGNQFQGGVDCNDLSCTDASLTMYFSGGSSGCGGPDCHRANESSPSLNDMRSGWLGFELCWAGN
jgi:hypothetical protein